MSNKLHNIEMQASPTIEPNKNLEEEAFLTIEDYGIRQVLIELKEMFRGRCNGWAALALMYGADSVTDKMNTSLATISLVCGLLLSATIPLILNPVEKIASLENDDPTKYLYTLFFGISIIFHFSSIMNSCLLTMLLATAARESDKLRIFMKFDRLPTLSFTLFCIGNFALIIGGGFAISAVFGQNSQIIWCCTTSGFCGLLFLLINQKFYLPVGHVAHGWYKNNKQDFIDKMNKIFDRMLKDNGERKLTIKNSFIK